MEKYRIATHKEEAPRLLALLQEFGTLELNKVSDKSLQENELSLFDHHRDSSRLDIALKFISKFHKEGGLRTALEGGRVHTTIQEIEKIVKKVDFEALVNKIQDLEGRLNEVERNLHRLKEEHHVFQAWERLSLPLNEDMGTENTSTLPLRGAGRPILGFQEKIREKTKFISFENVSDTTLLVTYLKEEKEIIDEAISNLGLERVSLPRREGTVVKELTFIAQEQGKFEKEKEKLEIEITKLAEKHIDELKILSDYYLWKKEQLDLALTAPSTNNVSIFEAWMPKNSVPEVKSKLEKEIKLLIIEPCALKKGEVTPTEIKNSKFMSAFETITRLYGLPTHEDLDPTPFLSIFFFVFFGLCLGDVGYGLILSLITGFVLSKYYLDATVKQLVTLLFYGGLGSMIAGVFLGGYLGIDPAILPSFISDFQLVDPVKSPLPIFYLSLSLGFLHIVFGVWLKLWRQVKAGNVVDGVLDDGPWLLFFIGLVAMILNMVGVLENVLNPQYSYLINWYIYSTLALIVLTQGRTSKNIFAKLLFGVLSLYNLVGYFSDVLSYSRILALGLATSALSFSINLIASFIGSLLPGFLGTIVTILILIAGHTLNVTIGIMSAFIHSARLQFVEFFSKFLIGSGRTFKPFLKLQRNVILLTQEKL